ncbi:MAG: UDP-N-acetylglucosamine 2-epimerase (non-hydrolyzing) [Vicinamibacterales bacterium]
MKISVIFGTRPEAIKLAPVVLALRREAGVETSVCVTGQHRQMLDQVLGLFEIKPDHDLDLMVPNQTLAGLTARGIEAVDRYLAAEKPDLILIQGDTTTTLCAALAAFYRHVPIGHVEAGLRTGNMLAPWPEEANRVLVSRLTRLHFAPTDVSRQNLLREGIADDTIFVTGNTGIDALFLAIDKVRAMRPAVAGLPDYLQPGSPAGNGAPKLVLITGHRRENFGGGFENICRSIAELARRFTDTHFVYPVHLNPNVREPVARLLGAGGSGTAALPNVHLLEPLPYLPFVGMLERSTVILSDSGGIQEEAPSLGKPVLVMRETTERPEGVQAGTVRLVGTDPQKIVGEVSHLLMDAKARDQMARAHNPYGDGHATGRIIAACRNFGHV